MGHLNQVSNLQFAPAFPVAFESHVRICLLHPSGNHLQFLDRRARLHIENLDVKGRDGKTGEGSTWVNHIQDGDCNQPQEEVSSNTSSARVRQKQNTIQGDLLRLLPINFAESPMFMLFQILPFFVPKSLYSLKYRRYPKIQSPNHSKLGNTTTLSKKKKNYSKQTTNPPTITPPKAPSWE